MSASALLLADRLSTEDLLHRMSPEVALTEKSSARPNVSFGGKPEWVALAQTDATDSKPTRSNPGAPLKSACRGAWPFVVRSAEDLTPKA
jgi:hypothetical protein